MKELNFDDGYFEEEDTDDEDEVEAKSKVLLNRYKITLEVLVKSESIDDAEMELKALVAQGVIAFLDNENKQPIITFDIIDSEPAEL